MSFMKKVKIIILTILIIFPALYCYSQEINESDNKGILLNEIVGNIANYKSKTITLRLKLKHVDAIFEKLTFYDRKNHDIEFDISDRYLKKRIATDMYNLHEGMDYNVTFIVQNVGNLGQIIAELKGFKPLILEAVPEGSTK
jgi:hypothetical protein